MDPTAQRGGLGRLLRARPRRRSRRWEERRSSSRRRDATSRTDAASTNGPATAAARLDDSTPRATPRWSTSSGWADGTGRAQGGYGGHGHHARADWIVSVSDESEQPPGRPPPEAVPRRAPSRSAARTSVRHPDPRSRTTASVAPGLDGRNASATRGESMHVARLVATDDHVGPVPDGEARGVSARRGCRLEFEHGHFRLCAVAHCRPPIGHLAAWASAREERAYAAAARIACRLRSVFVCGPPGVSTGARRSLYARGAADPVVGPSDGSLRNAETGPPSGTSVSPGSMRRPERAMASSARRPRAWVESASARCGLLNGSGNHDLMLAEGEHQSTMQALTGAWRPSTSGRRHRRPPRTKPRMLAEEDRPERAPRVDRRPRDRAGRRAPTSKPSPRNAMRAAGDRADPAVITDPARDRDRRAGRVHPDRSPTRPRNRRSRVR